VFGGGTPCPEPSSPRSTKNFDSSSASNPLFIFLKIKRYINNIFTYFYGRIEYINIIFAFEDEAQYVLLKEKKKKKEI
jgi:hypothetical protein